MWKIFTIEQNHNWIDILNDITQQYNTTKHRAVENNKPKDMLFDDIRIKPKEDLRPIKKAKFKLNDRVRVSLKRGVFQKAYEGGWSFQIYVVCEIINSNPINYKIKDEKDEIIAGSFYTEELQKTRQKDNIYLVEKVLDTKGKGKNKKVLVKWTGYDDTYNTWEPYSEIVNEKKFEDLE